MEKLGSKIHFTENQAQIAEFLESDNFVSDAAVKQYRSLFDKDYPYPVYFSVYKLLSIIFVCLSIAAMFVAAFFKEWIVLVGNVVFVGLFLLIFNFIRHLRYPNEEYRWGVLLGISLLSASIFALAIVYHDTLVSNYYFLTVINGAGLANNEILETCNSVIPIFTYIAIGLSIALTGSGVVFGQKRLASCLTPLITVGGLLLFLVIANAITSVDFLNSLVSDEGNFKSFWFYLILSLSLLAIIVYDAGLIFVTKLIGGPKSRRR